MSWEWSHAPAAYVYARKNLGKLSKKKLNIIYAEIHSANVDEYGNVSESTSDMDIDEYNIKLKKAKTLQKDVLVDFIWDFMEKFRTCDNGGFNAYCCPFGCHTVPMSP